MKAIKQIKLALHVLTIINIATTVLLAFMFWKYDPHTSKIIRSSALYYLLKIHWAYFLFVFLLNGCFTIGFVTVMKVFFDKNVFQSANDFRYNWAICLILSLVLTMNVPQFELVGALISFVLIFNRFMPDHFLNGFKWIDKQINNRLAGKENETER